jgi:hypothetical protein
LNIFSAFTFGSLIKTFIPGFVWLVAFGLVEAEISRALSGPPDIWQFASAHEQAALVLAIPAAILLGLLSNIAVFMGLNDWLVRKPVRKKYGELFALYDSLIALFRSKCWNALNLTNDRLRVSFEAYTDVEIMILKVIDLDELIYVREQYWYHLEFQVNLFISSIALFIALFLLSVVNIPDSSMLRNPDCSARNISDCLSILIWAFVFTSAALLSYVSLIPAARKNFERHISKISSLIATAIAAKLA